MSDFTSQRDPVWVSIFFKKNYKAKGSVSNICVGISRDGGGFFHHTFYSFDAPVGIKGQKVH